MGLVLPQTFSKKVVEELREPIHDDLLRGNITKSGNRTPFFDFNKNNKDESATLSSKWQGVAQMFVTQSHLKELVACNYCNFSHHKRYRL